MTFPVIMCFFSELLVLCSISARASLIKQSGEKWLTCLLRRLSLANFLAGRLSCCVKNQEQVETKQRQGLRTVSAVYLCICWKWGKVHIHKFTPLNWVDCCSIIEFWVGSFKANFINVHEINALCRYILVNIFMLLPLEIYSGYNGIKQIYVCICINLYRFFFVFRIQKNTSCSIFNFIWVKM